MNNQRFNPLRLRTLVSAALLAATVGAAGAHELRASTPADLAIAGQIQQRIADTASLTAKGADLTIRVDDGRVSLSGWVPYANDEPMARQLAASVPGVTKVVSTVKAWSTESDPRMGLPAVQAPADAAGVRAVNMAGQPADVALAGQVASALAAQPHLADAATSVAVDADGGRVTLTGFVTDADASEAAFSVARTVPGVVSIDNRLREWSTESLLPSSASSFSAPAVIAGSLTDAEVGERVRDALMASAPFQEGDSELTVAVQDGRVTLSGWVGYADDAVMARRIATQVPGVQSVTSRLFTWSSDAR